MYKGINTAAVDIVLTQISLIDMHVRILGPTPLFSALGVAGDNMITLPKVWHHTQWVLARVLSVGWEEEEQWWLTLVQRL